MKAPTVEESAKAKREWAEHNGLKEYTGSAYCGLRFLNHSIPSSYDFVPFPGADHLTYWNKNGKPYCIISQPYHFNMEEMKTAITLAQLYKLDFYVSAMGAWHYPGGVLFIEWIKQETE